LITGNPPILLPVPHLAKFQQDVRTTKGPANFSLRQIPEAEKSALQAQEIEANSKEMERDPRVACSDL
jgi:hypothetical protein